MNCDAAALLEAAKCYRCIPPGMQNSVATYLMCQWSNNIGPTCDPDAQAFLNYTQITDPVVSAAICQLVADLKANPASPAVSFWDRETIIYPMVPGPAANNLSWRANLKTPGTYDLLEVPGSLPTYSAQGIAGNSANSARLNTQYSPAVGNTDFALRIFHYVDADSLQGALTAYWSSWGSACAWSCRRDAVSLIKYYFKDSTDDSFYAAGNTNGAWCIQRVGTVAPEKWGARNGGIFVKKNKAQASNGTTFPINLFCLNNTGAYSQFSNVRFSGWSLGGIFSDDAEWLAYRGIWETFEAAMGRPHPLGV